MIRPVKSGGCATSAPLRQRPAIVIRLELEERPAVFMETLSEGDENRLRTWVNANEPLLDLVSRALDLADKAEAA
jgi:hypothetical protein